MSNDVNVQEEDDERIITIKELWIDMRKPKGDPPLEDYTGLLNQLKNGYIPLPSDDFIYKGYIIQQSVVSLSPIVYVWLVRVHSQEVRYYTSNLCASTKPCFASRFSSPIEAMEFINNSLLTPTEKKEYPD